MKMRYEVIKGNEYFNKGDILIKYRELVSSGYYIEERYEDEVTSFFDDRVSSIELSHLRILHNKNKIGGALL